MQYSASLRRDTAGERELSRSAGPGRGCETTAQTQKCHIVMKDRERERDIYICNHVCI